MSAPESIHHHGRESHGGLQTGRFCSLLAWSGAMTSGILGNISASAATIWRKHDVTRI